jgi:hypothetical protein
MEGSVAKARSVARMLRDFSTTAFSGKMAKLLGKLGK